MTRLQAWRFAEARTENNIDSTHSASRVHLFGTLDEFPEFFSGPERRTVRHSRELGRPHARRRARFRSVLNRRIAATALPTLPIRRRHALGRCARLSPLQVRFLQTHIQYPDQDTPCEVAQQGPLADFRRDNGRAKEHSQQRGGVRGERDDLVPMAEALPRMLLCSARKNSRGSHSGLFKCLCARGGSRGCDLGEGVAAGSIVLAGLKRATAPS
jgi:hypothetical protein